MAEYYLIRLGSISVLSQHQSWVVLVPVTVCASMGYPLVCFCFVSGQSINLKHVVDFSFWVKHSMLTAGHIWLYNNKWNHHSKWSQAWDESTDSSTTTGNPWSRHDSSFWAVPRCVLITEPMGVQRYSWDRWTSDCCKFLSQSDLESHEIMALSGNRCEGILRSHWAQGLRWGTVLQAVSCNPDTATELLRLSVSW